MLPITIITGYLGAGKTTLLNRLLVSNAGRRIAVVQNDYGEVPIDNDLILEVEEPEELVTLANGCACCTVRDDMVEAVQMLVDHHTRFEHIVLETSGLATPGSIIMTLLTHPDAGEAFVLDGVVAVVDALNLGAQLERGPEAAQQIAYADLIVLNKTDCVEAAALEAVVRLIRTINPLAEIIPAVQSAVDPEQILGIGGFDASRIAGEMTAAATSHEARHAHQPDVCSVSIVMEGKLDVERFEEWIHHLLEQHHGDIYRIKGVLNVAGSDRRYIVNAVHALWSRQYGRSWGDEERRSRLVLIGRNLDEAAIREEGYGCRVRSGNSEF